MMDEVLRTPKQSPSHATPTNSGVEFGSYPKVPNSHSVNRESAALVNENNNASYATTVTNAVGNHSTDPPPHDTTSMLTTQNNDHPHEAPVEYKTTPFRYVVLAQYSLCAWNNGLQWICFANIVDQTTEFFDITNLQLNWLSAIFYFMFIFTAFFAVAFFDKYGTRPSVLVASVCNFIGSIVKLIAALWFRKYPLLLISQIIAGTAQSFFLPVPAALSCVWFADSERTMATLVASISNPLGGAAGMILTTVFVNDENRGASAFLALFGFITAVNALDLLLVIFVIKDRPEHFASAAGHARHLAMTGEGRADISIKERVKKIIDESLPHLKKWNTVAILVGGGIAGGCFWTLTTLIAQMSAPFELSQRLVGWMGFFNVVFGIPVGLVVSRYVDANRIYKGPLLITVLCIIVLSGLFTLLLKVAPESAKYHLAALFIALGGPQNCALPISFEAAAETTFPLNENVCSTLVLMFSEIMALVFMNVLPPVLESSAFSSPQNASLVVCILMIVMNVISFIFLATGKVEMNRKNHALGGDDQVVVGGAAPDALINASSIAAPHVAEHDRAPLLR